MPIRFRVRWVPLVATLVVAAIGVSLGQWQTRRGDEKQAIQDKMAERQAAPAIGLSGNVLQLDIDQNEYRHVRVKGEFVSSWTSYLDNRPYNGAPGFYVLTPFKIADSDTAVLVERGWTPRDISDRTKVPALPAPAGVVEIEGVIRRDAGHLLQLGAAEAPKPGAIMQNLDLPAYAAASSLKLAPFLIEQGGAMKDGLVRDWPAPSLGIERHRGYAVQWYALALMAVIFFVVTGFRSGKK
ncbi:SURF1 family protein [Herbaspirillum rhizosphaerae]|uniref:SURF1 family protein n=1 Tax=Herbaspirillum rhizosphaerae TaxID=346179 RepID=UPI00067B6552|nr:SURF1 family protein [Herbaspirillum rhizosphaerae]